MIFSHITKLIFTAQYLQWVALDQPFWPQEISGHRKLTRISQWKGGWRG
jgi:hypothetical protein